MGHFEPKIEPFDFLFYLVQVALGNLLWYHLSAFHPAKLKQNIMLKLLINFNDVNYIRLLKAGLFNLQPACGPWAYFVRPRKGSSQNTMLYEN